MKKRNIIVSIIILMILFIKIDVNAATNTSCSTNDLSIYRLEANNVSLDYQLSEKDPYKPYSEPYYDLVISNITNNITVTVNKFDYTVADTNDGEIIFKRKMPAYPNRFVVQIKTSKNTECPDKFLMEKSISISYYNKFSTFEKCNGYEDKITICMPNANTYAIDESDFDEVFEKQKKDYESSVEKVKGKKKNIFSWYMDNKKVTIPITIVIVLVATTTTIVIFIKNKKKIKINLGDEIQ